MHSGAVVPTVTIMFSFKNFGGSLFHFSLHLVKDLHRSAQETTNRQPEIGSLLYYYYYCYYCYDYDNDDYYYYYYYYYY